MEYMLDNSGVTHYNDVFNEPFVVGQDYFCLKEPDRYIYIPDYMIYDYLGVYEDNDLYDLLDSDFPDWSIETCSTDYEPERGIK